MADKSKQNLANLLGGELKKPEIRRGQGIRLSTETAPTDAETQKRENAETQKRRNAETQEKPERVNRGYMLREDLIHELRLLAVREKRKLYEVMEEALEQYLERRHGDV